MSVGNPALAAPGSARSAWQSGGVFGVQPAGPIAGPTLRKLDNSSRAGTSDVGHRARLGNPGPLRATAGVPYSGGGLTGGPGGILPSSGALDYAHKFTQTTLLVGGALGFLLLYRRAPGRAVRAVIRKHVGEV